MFLVTSSSLLLEACGFRLRGSVELPQQFATVYIEGVAAYSDLGLEVQNALQRSGGNVVKLRENATAVLVITQNVFSRRVLSVDTAGKPNEYELNYQLKYHVLEQLGAELLASRSISMLRDYRFDPDQILAKRDEESRIKKEMLRSVVQQMMRSISIGMKKKRATPPENKTQALHETTPGTN